MTPNQSSHLNIPTHVAIIMDGNGRWAKARGLDRSEGHVEGVNTVRRITEAASKLGIKYLTLYTFSTENWNRPQAEVSALMSLIVMAIERETPDLIKNNVRLHMIGDVDALYPEARARLQKCIADTAHCTGLTLILALSYSARWEITRAARLIAQKAANGEFSPSDISDATIQAHLATVNTPTPTCSSAPVATCASPTSCFGKSPTPKFTLPPHIGPISPTKISSKPFLLSQPASAVSASPANN